MEAVTVNALLNAAYCFVKSTKKNIVVCRYELFNVFKAAYSGRYCNDLVDFYYKPVTCFKDVTCSIEVEQVFNSIACNLSITQHD